MSDAADAKALDLGRKLVSAERASGGNRAGQPHLFRYWVRGRLREATP